VLKHCFYRYSFPELGNQDSINQLITDLPSDIHGYIRSTTSIFLENVVMRPVFKELRDAYIKSGSVCIKSPKGCGKTFTLLTKCLQSHLLLFKSFTGFVESCVEAVDIPDTLKKLKENRMATMFDILRKHQDTKLFIDLSRFHTTAASNNNYGVFF